MIDMDVLRQSGLDVQEGVFLKNKTWLGVGGPADYYVEIPDEQALCTILKFAGTNGISLIVLGAGSNVLIRDGGISGIVIKLGKSFSDIVVVGDTMICGGGALLSSIANMAAQHNIAGFEFMSGIPGSLGGGCKTNAGAYGSDLGHMMIELSAFDMDGNKHLYYPHQEDIFDYRNCKLPPNMIFIGAKFQGIKEENNSKILARMQDYKNKRQASQPQGVRTAGSTFKNPPENSAWKLLNEVGLRGYTENGAQFSDKHPNFLINTGTASAEDLERLIRLAQQKVLDKSGINLECEIQILGKEKS